jgi:hypothetical protein
MVCQRPYFLCRMAKEILGQIEARIEKVACGKDILGYG